MLPSLQRSRVVAKAANALRCRAACTCRAGPPCVHRGGRRLSADQARMCARLLHGGVKAKGLRCLKGIGVVFLRLHAQRAIAEDCQRQPVAGEARKQLALDELLSAAGSMPPPPLCRERWLAGTASRKTGRRLAALCGDPVGSYRRSAAAVRCALCSLLRLQRFHTQTHGGLRPLTAAAALHLKPPHRSTYKQHDSRLDALCSRAPHGVRRGLHRVPTSRSTLRSRDSDEASEHRRVVVRVSPTRALRGGVARATVAE